MSTAIIGRIDEMGNRIDDLEKSIGDLMAQVCASCVCCMMMVADGYGSGVLGGY